MAAPREKKRFLLRLDPEVHAALERWAADELRSVNAQMEFLLSEALRWAGRHPTRPAPNDSGSGPPGGRRAAR